MAYSELIKDFNRIRDYLRSFYVYGFRHRDDYTQKSARSYDNERRRIESWLGDYMSFGQDKDGKRVFLSVDSRAIPENPLYRAFRAKSVTDTDIMLHFHIQDILKDADGLSVTGVMDALSERLSEFDDDEMPDESTVRNKLREYAAMGLIGREKRGRETRYVFNRDQTDLSTWDAAAAFFSEALPLGVIGSFVQDRIPERFRRFRFKHHYILNALDSEILCSIFLAIRDRRQITFTARGQAVSAVPLKVFVGTQTGRQYLLSWSREKERFSFHRVDLMDRVKTEDPVALPEELKTREAEFRAHTWGVAGKDSIRPEHIDFTVFAGPEEGFIIRRLEREKRCGTVTRLDETHWRFSADVYDPLEMMPWLRTFTGRVTDLRCTDERIVARFREDLDEIARMYGGDEDAVS